MGKYKDLNDYEIMYMIQENEEDARNILFQKYYPIIRACAKKYLEHAKKYGFELEDLIQEGYLGLEGAIKHYNANEKTLFYTYAIISIRSKILNCCNKRNQERKNVLSPVSLSEMVSDKNELTLMDVLEDKNASLPHLLIEEDDLLRQIKEFMFSMNFPESLIFELRMNGFSMVDISQLLNLSNRTIANILYRVRKQLKTSLFRDCKKEN